ncbi:lipid A core-O-antigen ligase-like enyme [Saprospira grandis DSM 2844]|uniref:Lipid A core-O-antigen ligase-like enyme n=1 Tax=Saprospira grandis DSM 2844 TaxID=694433 RepID=J1I8J7_9BACT|nr:O-antigen ligase family protein [Saprospira grandis]EJF54798.1 lipid A core-O-antigen ligase-like enyme [Saprospira grandis DSM 2844]
MPKFSLDFTIHPRLQPIKQQLFWALAALSLLAILASLLLEELVFLALPFGVLLAYQALVDYRVIYYLLFTTLPLSTEVFFSDSLATDLPTEPLIVGVLLLYILLVLTKPKTISGAFWLHPLSLLLILHFAWTAFSCLLSDSFTISLKFTLAKLWYIGCFYFMTGHLIRKEKQLHHLWWWVIVPLAFASFKVVAHHALLDFGFKEINRATSPFFRNHVNYAAVLTFFLPILYFFGRNLKKWSWGQLFIGASFCLFFFGMLTAYTRAAYVSLVLAVVAYFIIQFKLMRWALLGASLAVLLAFGYLIKDNNFMELAPSERTISHKEFGDIVAATYKLEDVSTSERYYRWVAGARMSTEAPWVGFGPGTFYTYYKQYSLNRFQTYVSDNPERSGIHNYFLMLLVEQGYLGMLLFIFFLFYGLILGEKVYHQSQDARQKRATMGLMMMLVIISAFLLMNDLIETDKVGSFFFFAMAILVNFDLRNRRLLNSPKDVSQ